MNGVNTTISALQERAFKNARKKGFHDLWFLLRSLSLSDSTCKEMRQRILASYLALISSEVSEALEELRADRDGDSFAEELADILIRVLDLGGLLNLDLEAAVLKKMDRNEERPKRHGKQF